MGAVEDYSEPLPSVNKQTGSFHNGEEHRDREKTHF